MPLLINPAALGIEIHTTHPESLVAFYEATLNVRFERTTYPFLRYIANLHRFSLIVADACAAGGASASSSGKTILLLLTDEKSPCGEASYPLYPRRVISGMLPDRYAVRLTDPDGNYLALTPSMEQLLGRLPPVSTLPELAECIREF